MARRPQYPPPFAQARTIVAESLEGTKAHSIHDWDHKSNPLVAPEPVVEPEPEVVEVVEVAPEPVVEPEPEPEPIVEEAVIEPAPVEEVAPEPEVVEPEPEEIVAEEEIEFEIVEEVEEVEEHEIKWKPTMKKADLLAFCPPELGLTLENTKAEIIEALELFND